MKVLLLQARDPSDPMRLEERRSFAEKAGVDEEQFVPHDLLTGPPSIEDVRRHDTLMVGGSGDYYVSKGNLPQFDALLDLLREVVDLGHPTFASCFGYQLLVEALDGEIVHDPGRTEVGTYELTLTDEATEDELFSFLPRKFAAQLGRKDRAGRLPPKAVNLAFSDLCPFHALRIPRKPIWATQFHPELSCEENKARFMYYLEGYGAAMTPEQRREALDRFDESPEANQLIPRFIELVLG